MRSVADIAIRRAQPWLGTLVEITAPEGCEAAIDAAFATVARIHGLMSFHEETSDLAVLRRARPGSIVTVARETAAVLKTAALLHARSQGLFDITVGARLVAWGFLPSPLSTYPEASCGTAADIEIVDDDHVICHRPMLIDLGGIAKGFAVDCAIETLEAAGVRHGVVNAGGDLRVFGDRSEAIHLRGVDGVIEASIEVRDAAVASSSNAHQRRYTNGAETSPHVGRHHNAILTREAITVIADRCVIADAMTKIALADRSLAETLLLELDGALVSRPTRRLAA